MLLHWCFIDLYKNLSTKLNGVSNSQRVLKTSKWGKMLQWRFSEGLSVGERTHRVLDGYLNIPSPLTQIWVFLETDWGINICPYFGRSSNALNEYLSAKRSQFKKLQSSPRLTDFLAILAIRRLYKHPFH